MARTRQLQSGNVGEDTVRCKPLAPRGTGSDGSRLHRGGNIPPIANEAPRGARSSRCLCDRPPLFRRPLDPLEIARAADDANYRPTCTAGDIGR